MGIAVSNGITNSFNLILMMALCKKCKLHEAFYWFDQSSCEGLNIYFNLGFYSMMMCCLKSWAYSIQNLLASIVSPNLIAAQSLLHNITRNYYTFSYGLQQAGGAMIGKSVGEGDVEKA